MVKADKDALLCDLAETYNIYSFTQVPLRTLSILARGLRETSRIKMKLAEAKVPTDTMLLMSIVDRLNLILWSGTKDGMKGRNRPEPILKSLEMETKKPTAYATGKDFDEARQRILLEIERRERK